MRDHLGKMEMTAFLTRERFSNTLVPIKAMDLPKRIAKMTFSTQIAQDTHQKRLGDWLGNMMDAKKKLPSHCKGFINLFSEVQEAGTTLPPNDNTIIRSSLQQTLYLRRHGLT